MKVKSFLLSLIFLLYLSIIPVQLERQVALFHFLAIPGKRAMKKFVILFLLLMIGGGAALYFGWVKVEPGEFKIAHSTITGTLDYPLESGNFYWVWQKLIPKTFSLYSVEKEPHRENIETLFSLPGSDQLKDFGSFEFEVRTSIQYRIDFEAAKQLLDEGTLSGFNDYFSQRIRFQIDEIVSNYLLESMVRLSENNDKTDSSLLNGLKKQIGVRIEEHVRSYRLKDMSYNVTFITIPQFEMYREALERYTMYMDTFYTIKEQELEIEYEKMKQQGEVDIEIERLRKYGELINRYPVLLKYLYIQRFSENAEVILIPHEATTGFPKMLEPETGEEVPQRSEPSEKSYERSEGLAERGLSEDIPPEKEISPKEDDQGKEKEQTSTKWYDALKFWKYLQKER